jgi:hypothetical protein
VFGSVDLGGFGALAFAQIRQCRFGANIWRKRKYRHRPKGLWARFDFLKPARTTQPQSEIWQREVAYRPTAAIGFATISKMPVSPPVRRRGTARRTPEMQPGGRAHHEEAFESAPVALLAIDRGGRVVLANRRAGRAGLLPTGPGVAAHVRPKVFETFVSSKETGIGVELPVSKRVAEDHGGGLTAYNLPAGGACFALRLPAAA